MITPRFLPLACLMCLPASVVLAQPADPPARTGAPVILRTDVMALVEKLADQMNREFIFNPQDLYTLSAQSTEGAGTDYDSLLALLRQSGFVAIENGDQIRIVRDVQMRAEGAPLMQEDRRGVSDHTVVTRVLTVNGIQPAQLVPILRPMMPQSAQLGAVQGTSSLILVDFYDNVRRMTEVIREVEATAAAETAANATDD